ncbi:hypothetical protein [uncultured Cohaesibacter sp.]|uniref:hypothetical protein n=1 Tax=uncultured Cohaesibacter sp. TaxID=1002546 RepID=UPI0029C89B3E|nr:hypothetical protein [uncultured Cohaesibacter sp.]
MSQSISASLRRTSFKWSCVENVALSINEHLRHVREVARNYSEEIIPSTPFIKIQGARQSEREWRNIIIKTRLIYAVSYTKKKSQMILPQTRLKKPNIFGLSQENPFAPSPFSLVDYITIRAKDSRFSI